MKAIVLDRYGPPSEVLSLQDVDRPVPGPHDVLVRVRAAGVDPGIWHLVRGEAYVGRLVLGLRRPRRQVVGQDVAGLVEEVGSDVGGFSPGDEVFAQAGGTLAELVRVSEDLLEHKPAGLTFQEAAAVPLSANTALLALRDVGGLRAGQTVLVNGASGGVGTFAVQIAAAYGAHVTAVCGPGSDDLVRSLGAEHVVDHTAEDVTRSGKRYDLILDLAGSHSVRRLRKALTSHGTLVLCSGNGGRWFGPVGRIVVARLLSPFVKQRLRTVLAQPSRQNLATLKELIDSGRLRPVVDSTYPLAETADAIRHVEAGHPRGKVVVVV
ncbi:MAG TPA: NAD(P)-dependent alcohol dehydrogenase [Actinotalea sp.]|jgi:NADPH:quinone reductase-like Zn-dependent oxidoreductase